MRLRRMQEIQEERGRWFSPRELLGPKEEKVDVGEGDEFGN